MEIKHIAYGPVPSRRLGHSLGINNIPPKICSYSCLYCQLGNTINMQVKRETFYKAEEIAQNANAMQNLASSVFDRITRVW